MTDETQIPDALWDEYESLIAEVVAETRADGLVHARRFGPTSDPALYRVVAKLWFGYIDVRLYASDTTPARREFPL